MTLAELRGDVVILACAISAGIHGALVRGHFAESLAAGLGFVAATVSLAGLVVWLSRHPDSAVAIGAAALTLFALLAGYTLAVTTGLPVLHPDPEPVDGLALASKAIEGVGLLAATSLLSPALPQPKGT